MADSTINVTITQPPVVQASVSAVPTVLTEATGIGVKGDKGDKGDQGIQGIQGVQGIQGIQGEAATIEVGTITTADPGEDAEVSNAGTANDAIFDFTIPAGAMWRVGTGAPSDAVGRNGDYYLDEATSNVYLKATDTYSIVANIKGEQGIQGIQGIQGEQGIPGAAGEIPGGTDGNLVGINSSGFIEDSGYAPSDFAPALGGDDNYVTDDEKTKLSNLSGTNTGDQDLSSYATKTGAETLTNKTLTSPVINGEITGTSAPYNSSMARQAIINGNFDVWQRGTSLVWTDGGPLLADRWAFYPTADGGTLPTITLSRQAITPGELDNSFYFHRVNVNGAGSSLGANSIAQLLEKIEYGTRYLCGNGKKVTVSFWAKSDIADKKLGVSLYQNYGTTGSPSAEEIITGEAFTLTSSWAKYTHTFTTNTLSGKTFGTSLNDWLGLQFSFMWGSTKGTALGLGSAETFVGSGNIDIAQVQLCAGEVALPFMPKDYGQELLDCSRYYQITRISGIAYDTGFISPACSFSPPMRTSPTSYTFYDGIGGNGTANQLARLGGANATVSSLDAIEIGSYGIGYINKTGAFVAGGHYRGSVRADAEL